MDRLSLWILVPLWLAFVFLVSLSPAYAHPPLVTNLALAGRSPVVCGEFVAFRVRESDTDLNGDGDTLDFVAHTYHAPSGTTRNTGLSSGQLAFQQGVLAFLVAESDQGVDLNGDGDSTDSVAHLHDVALQATTNLALSVGTSEDLRHGGDLVAIRVLESGEGSDLNADGDQLDSVAHVVHVPSGIVTNIGINSINNFLVGDSIAMLVKEAHQGNTDLNGDGDTLDDVLHVYDTKTGIVTNLAVAVGEVDVSNTLVVFRVFESERVEDLNGDGDMTDSVVHAYDTITNTTINFGLDANFGLSASGTLVVLNVRESRQGNTDLNGDGDRNDEVVHVFDSRSQLATNLRLASGSCNGPTVSPNLVGVAVPRGSALIAHIYDARSGIIRDSGFPLGDPNDPPQVGINFTTFAVSESAAGADLNGDGDTNDNIGHVYDPVSGNSTNLSFGFNRSIDLDDVDGDSVLFGVNEFFHGSDLNGDGDISFSDFVLHIHDATLAVTTNLGLVSGGAEAQSGHLVAVTVRESWQGNTDLNGDGDTADDVIHVAGFPCAAGTVNSGVGPVVDVLRVNGLVGRVNVAVGQPINASFDPAPMGPSPAPYVLWVWPQGPSSPTTVNVLGAFLGCTTNPTPLHVGQSPQPFICLRSPALPSLACHNVNDINGPANVPWSRTRATGFGQKRTFTVQGLIRDNGSANSTGYSITNSVILDVQ